MGKIVLRLRLLSLALSITEYIAAVRRLIRVGAGELIILGADHDAELRAPRPGCFVEHESAFIEAADQRGLARRREREGAASLNYTTACA